MIYFFVVQNLQGMSRFSKWFSHLEDRAEMRNVESDVHRLTAFRGDEMTNALTFTIDLDDNELALLESIHLLVEILDSYFKNVCELDLVFNFNKMLAIIDEFYLAGEMQEANKEAILTRIRENEKLD